jgi:hydrogenase expression/formation protein HypE
MVLSPLPPGKLPVTLLRRLLVHDASRPADLLLPPAIGEDAAAIDIKGGALVAATDPITLTGREIGAHSVIINANDVAVMGARPRWFLAVLLLPQGTVAAQVQDLFDNIRAALDSIGATLVGGHTEITAAVNQPVIVGQMLGFREDGRFIRTGGVQAEDVVLQIGYAPIEGAAVLAVEADGRLANLAPDVLARARKGLHEPGISIVGPALRAAELGATALHDPTEGGLSTGLHELAEASGVALEVDADAILWFGPGLAICEELGADPWGVMASGTLLAAFPPDLSGPAEKALRSAGHAVAIVARAVCGKGVYLGADRPLIRYEQDELSRLLAEPQQPG